MKKENSIHVIIMDEYMSDMYHEKQDMNRIFNGLREWCEVFRGRKL